MEFIFLLWIVFALLTISVYTQRGHSAGYGALVGLMLGPVGLIVALTKPNIKGQAAKADETTCPFCAEIIKKEAQVCRHCGRDLGV